MTIQEKLESIKGKKVAIWCETPKESQYLVDELNEITGEDYPECYERYTDICYTLDEYNQTGVWCYGSKIYYKDESFQVISYKDFVNNYMEDGKIHLVNDDINQILNDKYGKDNWVVKR